jgi:hypothetical protein
LSQVTQVYKDTDLLTSYEVTTLVDTKKLCYIYKTRRTLDSNSKKRKDYIPHTHTHTHTKSLHLIPMPVIANEPERVFLFRIIQCLDVHNFLPFSQTQFGILLSQDAFLLQVVESIVDFLSIVYWPEAPA